MFVGFSQFSILDILPVLQALIAPFSELSELDLERYFNFALMWSFGGTLEYKDRDAFSWWWKNSFDECIDIPDELCVSKKVSLKCNSVVKSHIIYGVITLAVSGTGTGTGSRTRAMGDNRCWPLSLFRCNVKGST